MWKWNVLALNIFNKGDKLAQPNFQFEKRQKELAKKKKKEEKKQRKMEDKSSNSSDQSNSPSESTPD